VKIEKRKGATTFETVLVIGFFILFFVVPYVNEEKARNEISRLQKEQKNQIANIFGAIKETAVISKSSDNQGVSTVVWKFHKEGDKYGEAPHTAKIIDDTIVELDGKAVKATLVELGDPPSGFRGR